MAAFKVGQRVRLVSQGPFTGTPRVPIGTEGVVIGAHVHPTYGIGYEVSFNGLPSSHPSRNYFCYADMLAPILDPGAESFIAKLKKLGSEPLNAVEKEGVK